MAQQIKITQTSNADMNIGVPKNLTAIMQLINFILVERRQEDGLIKFHAHDDFNRFLQMEKEQIMKAFLDGKVNHSKDWAEEYYNETYGENKD